MKLGYVKWPPTVPCASVCVCVCWGWVRLRRMLDRIEVRCVCQMRELGMVAMPPGSRAPRQAIEETGMRV